MFRVFFSISCEMRLHAFHFKFCDRLKWTEKKANKMLRRCRREKEGKTKINRITLTALWRKSDMHKRAVIYHLNVLWPTRSRQWRQPKRKRTRCHKMHWRAQTTNSNDLSLCLNRNDIKQQKSHFVIFHFKSQSTEEKYKTDCIWISFGEVKQDEMHLIRLTILLDESNLREIAFSYG